MVRERSDPVASEPEALRAWRSGACGARRPAQTAPNRGKAPAPGRRTPGGRTGEPAPWPTPRCEAVPGRVRMRLAHAARMALAQPAIGAHDPRWPAHCRITGCQVVRGMTLFDNRSPRIVVLRRKGRTFADAGGACRAVIGCALAGGAGDCDRPRQDRLPGLRRGFWRCFD